MDSVIQIKRVGYSVSGDNQSLAPSTLCPRVPDMSSLRFCLHTTSSTRWHLILFRIDSTREPKGNIRFSLCSYNLLIFLALISCLTIHIGGKCIVFLPIKYVSSIPKLLYITAVLLLPWVSTLKITITESISSGREVPWVGHFYIMFLQ